MRNTGGKFPTSKRLEFYNIPEPATRLAMVKRGEADIATLMQGVYYEDLKKTQNLRMLAPLSPVRWVAYPTAQWDPQVALGGPKGAAGRQPGHRPPDPGGRAHARLRGR